MKKIAIIVPTIRPERMRAFINIWAEQIIKYEVSVYIVWDHGDVPYVERFGTRLKLPVQKIMGKYSNLIFNKSDVCRNLGFAMAKWDSDPDIYISLDDDVKPDGDTIGKHIEALEHRTSISWVSTLSGLPVRGVPYGVRDEAPVMLSHGTWKGVPDLDAPSQLVNGIPKEYTAVRGPIPRGVYFPLCAMNFAFKAEALPYVYQAPMNTHGLDRFGDIWAGIYLKRAFDKKGWAVYTGHASVIHDRASNVFKNLQKEAKGLELNEGVYKFQEHDPYFKLYKKCREDWIKYLKTI